ncbi:MAG: hypothetical protein AAGD22_02145 [Verrucomicrobiota bacterium]
MTRCVRLGTREKTNVYRLIIVEGEKENLLLITNQPNEEISAELIALLSIPLAGGVVLSLVEVPVALSTLVLRERARGDPSDTLRAYCRAAACSLHRRKTSETRNGTLALLSHGIRLDR